MSNRRGALGLLLGAGAVAGLAQDAAIGGPAVPARALLDVMDFGAKGDGIADDTAAFVAALNAARQVNREHNGVSIPPGTFRVDGPVGMRPGQSLTGSGYATLIDARKAKGPVFVCDNGGEPDNGGPPVAIGRLRGLGGASGGAFIRVNVAGFALSDMFLSAPGIGLHIDCAADGIISDIQIDQGLNGLVINNSQNLVISSILLFNTRFGLTLSGNCADIGLSGSQFSYSQYASILAADGARIRGLAINGCAFTSNEQRESFLGHIHCRALEMTGTCQGTHFRNWRGFAIRQAFGADVHLDFGNCSFDGLRSNVVYNQSLDASVIMCAPGGVYNFSACQFRNLQGPLVSLGDGPGEVTISGGSLSDSSASIVTGPARSLTQLSFLQHDGVAMVKGNIITLPIWPKWAGWRLAISGQTNAHGRISCEIIVLPLEGGRTRSITVWASVERSFVSRTKTASGGLELELERDISDIKAIASSIV